MKWLGALYFAATTAQAAGMIELSYVDQDRGDAPYPTRILITPDFLRMDGGESGGDFVLLDRKRQQVVNVMRASGTALVFRRAELPSRPLGWKASQRVTRATEGNRVRVSVKGVECSDTTTAKGLHPDAVRALTELKTVLAERQYATWKVTPSDLQYDCDLANQVWEFKTPLKYGLPVSERDFGGRTRRLQTHRIVPAKPELFKLPADVSLRDAPDL